MYKGLASLLASCAAAASTPIANTSNTSIATSTATVVKSSSSTGCITACTRYRTCAPRSTAARQVDDCVRDCNTHLTPAGQAHYGDCMSQLTCQAVKESLTLDEGPAGYCYSSSLE